MPSLMERISILSSAVRTILAAVVVGALGLGGWYGYATFNAGEREAKRNAEALAGAKTEIDRMASQLEQKDTELNRKNAELDQKKAELEQKDVELKEKAEEISALNVELQKKEKEIQQLDTALRLLKVDHRIARLTVLDQTDDSDGGLVSLVEFQELNDQGDAIDEPKQFRVKGDLVYIDCWVVKFDDKYVEQADLERSTSLVLFRRIFGEKQEPRDGYALDQEGARPAVYGRAGRMSELERKIWDDFWNVANNEARQAELGIRAAHGDAPSIKVQKGRAYRVELRASDGLSITPAGAAPPRPAKPAA